MKRSELYLFFSTIFIGVAIFMVALFYFIKPANIYIKESQLPESDINKDSKSYNNGWINKISTKNQVFSYPTVIYKLKL